MNARHRRHANEGSKEGYVAWLRAAAVAGGLVAAVSTGHGVASATPSDSPNPHATGAASEPGSSTDADHRSAAVTARSADDSAPTSGTGSRLRGSPADRPTLSMARHDKNAGRSPEKDARQDPDDAAGRGTSTKSGTTVHGTQATKLTTDTAGVDGGEATPGRGPTETKPESGPTGTTKADDASDLPDTSASVAPTPMRKTGHSDVVAPHDANRRQIRPRGTHTRVTDQTGATDQTASVTSTASGISPRAAQTASAPSAPSGVTPPQTPTTVAAVAGKLAAPAPQPASSGIITDVLTWLGPGPLANNLPAPAAPLRSLVESLWLLVRHPQGRLNIPYPIAQSATPFPGLGGLGGLGGLAAGSPSDAENADVLASPAAVPDVAGVGAQQAATAQALSTVPLTIIANDIFGRPRDINVSQFNLLIFHVNTLSDQSRNIETYVSIGLNTFGIPGIPVIEGSLGWDPSAVTAQANTAVVYDYYKNVLDLTSFDGNGAPIVLAVDYNPLGPFLGYFSGYDNAYWDTDNKQLVFGDSGEFEGALDIVGHEYTHAVITYIVGQGGPALVSGESGALNEAYADIMGSLIEGKSGPDRWLIGEDTENGGAAVRSLADPTSFQTPYGPYRDQYATRYTGTKDEGGVHANSTIFSHAAYLMMTDPATTDISDETWAKVFYTSLYQLTPNATFTDGRAAVLGSAIGYGFTPAQQEAIGRAFDDVGIVAPSIVVV